MGFTILRANHIASSRKMAPTSTTLYSTVRKSWLSGASKYSRDSVTATVQLWPSTGAKPAISSVLVMLDR